MRLRLVHLMILLMKQTWRPRIPKAEAEDITVTSVHYLQRPEARATSVTGSNLDRGNLGQALD